MAEVVKLGQPVVFRPGTASDERWGPGQFLSAMITNIQGNQASLLVFPDAYPPYFEIRVARDDSLSVDRTWTPTTGENQALPEAPADGQIYGRRNQAWTPISGEDQGLIQCVIVSDVAPPTTLVGLAWFDTTINNFYVAEQGKWVEPAHLNPPEEISVNISPPFVHGIVGLDEMLTCDVGAWTSNPTSYLFQWRRNELDIVGQTTNHYTIVVADVDQVLSCAVTALNVVGVSQVAISNLISVTAPTNSVAPFVAGTVAAGATFTCSNGGWITSSDIEAYAYQWYRNGVAISGATAFQYTLIPADTNTDLSCAVTATNAVGISLPSMSNVILIRTPSILEAPTISGQIALGAVLSCTTGVWASDPTSYAYQWYRGAAAIAGAIANTYTIVSADANNTLICKVIATNPIGASLPATSNGLNVTAPTLSIAPVASGGILWVSQTFFCSTGVWIGTPTGYTYQWERNNQPISGATSNQYFSNTLNDLSSALTCKVIASNGFGASAPAVSNQLLIPTGAKLKTSTAQNVQLLNGDWSAYHSNISVGGAQTLAFRNSGKWLLEWNHLIIDGHKSGHGLLKPGATYAEATEGQNGLIIRLIGGQLWVDGHYSGHIVGPLADGMTIQWALDLDSNLVWCRRWGGFWFNDINVVPGVSGGASFNPGSFAPAVWFGGDFTNNTEGTYCQMGQGGMQFSVTGFVSGWPET